MNRRRILLSYLANSFSWELYSKTYFYNELVPTTINSKNVLNKAKIVKVSGNGVIENQLVQLSNIPSTNTTNGITFTKNDDGSLTISGTATSTFDKVICASVSLTNGRKYLSITYSGSANYLKNWISGVASGETYDKGMLFTTNNNGNVSLYMTFYSGKQYNFTFYPQITDLTLREGTGNEPTSLTDNRIQNILNRGYIAFNLGEYKGTDIGEFKSEPYNLLNLDRTAGTGGDFSNTTPRNFEDGKYYIGLTANNYCSPNTNSDFSINNGSVSFATNSTAYGVGFPIKVVGGQKYIFDYTSTDTGDAGTRYISWYDKDGNFISFVSGLSSYSKTAPQNAYWGVALLRSASQMTTITYTNICFHVAGTRTGYAEHKTFTPITFKAQLNGAINSHDTMEITNSAYVFTRNQWKYTFNGSENFTRAGTNVSGVYRYWFYGLSNVKGYANSQIADILCDNLTADTNDHIYLATNDYSIGIFADGGFDFIVKSITDVATMQSFMNGKTMHYPLATPQVITIPRKHLGIVDLGSLNWQKESYTYGGQSVYRFKAQVSGIKVVSTTNVIHNVYCAKYMTDTAGHSFQQTSDKIIALDTNSYVVVNDSDYANATDFTNAMAGVLLFYETENEVADITDTIDIESGGTITTDSEVLPNIELSVKCK